MLLEAKELTLGYAGVPLVSSLSFDLAAGDVLAVVGHNGSGKSTLVKTLLGVIEPVAGQFHWTNGKPSTVAYLGQRAEFDGRFPIRVRDLAAMGTWRGLGLLGRLGRAEHRRIEDALHQTNISHIADQPLHVLSAGQLQRALFARAMVQNAPLLLLDEPFTAIDQTTESQLLDLIDVWAAEGRAVILVLHDLSAVLQHCNKALLIGNGMSRFGEPREVLTPANLVEQNYLSSSQAAWIETMFVGHRDGVQDGVQATQASGSAGHV
ncbi:MAG: metal ABC transporter ATP-binding protein [Pseudomonadota bacterium]